ncbi:MAG: MFS transporter, partial [Aliifodinibius sp.]|nr:MFS transporter [Candidatus Saccharibacteria bacterium]NIV16186.1 MFS transporter [Fodinibius sp.]
IAVGIAMLFVAITAPVLGAIADFSASKKKFLLFYSASTWVFTGLLFFVQRGDIFIGMLFFILAEIGYRSGQVFYNSILPEIATPDELGRVSGNGWAIGSAGGILCLIIILPFIVIFDGALVVRLSFIFTAIYFAISTIPLFLWFKEKAEPQPLPSGENYLTIGFKRIIRTMRSVRQYREFLKFIVAFLIYNDGILMALNFAAIIGAVLFGMEETQLIIFMIIVQITSIAGAFLGGFFGDRVGYKFALVASVIMMIGVVIWMMFTRSLLGFFVIGGFAGFALTAVQS